MKRRTFVISGVASGVGLATAALPAYAQASPPKSVSGIIGGKTVYINYYSPSMRGRKIFGALVPYDEVWCPGANWATTIKSLDAGLEVGTMKFANGLYSIWVRPSENEWKVIFNSDGHAFHLDHDPDKDLGELKMDVKPLDKPVESLTFEIRSEGGNKGTVALLWEQAEASFPFTVVP